MGKETDEERGVLKKEVKARIWVGRRAVGYNQIIYSRSGTSFGLTDAQGVTSAGGLRICMGQRSRGKTLSH